ncbi:MAG: multidrug effflux MFS transporter [Alphaproteobacteria bacterium]|nr:multidrug effflux MFS transporter [Alphaproteobacteria bacterium]
MSEPAADARPRIPPVAFLGVLAAISPLSLSIPVQSIPEIATSLATPYGAAQLVVSAFLFSFAISQLLVGPLSDKLGRRPVLYGGLLIYGLASVGAAFAPNIELLITARVLQGAGGCAALVTSRAVVQDTHTGIEAARMMAFVAMLQSVAPAVGPILGGSIDALLGWRWIFGSLAIFAGLLALGTSIWLNETRPTTGGQADSWGTIFSRYARVLRSRLYIGYTMAFTFGTIGFFGFLAVGPALLIGGKGFTPFDFSLALVVIASQFVTGAWVSSRLVRFLGMDRTLWIAMAGVTIPSVALFFVHDSPSIVALVAPFVVYAFFNGFIFPNALAGATGVDPRIAGSAASFLGFAQLGTGSVLAFVLSNLDTSDALFLSLFLVALGVLATCGMLLVKTAER